MVYDVSELASQIKGVVLTPGDEGYQNAIHRWASNAERNAAVVAQVTSPQDVVAAVPTPHQCSRTNLQLKFAKKASLEVAVSGGKHSASGASSTEGGLLIDLSKMRKVRVNTTNNTIIAQGGCLWIDVDQAAADHGLATGYIVVAVI